MTEKDSDIMLPKFVLTVKTGDQSEVINADAGACLLDILRQHRLYVNSPCGGQGTCEKCKVKVLNGQLERTASDNERPLPAMPGETVLACRCQITGDCSIDISALKEANFSGNADFDLFAVHSFNTGLETLPFVPSKECWKDGSSIAGIISDSVGRQLTFTAKALRQLSFWMGNSLHRDFSGPEPDQPIFLTLQDNRVLLVRTSESAPVYGIGVDIGTTTVALSLVDLERGMIEKKLVLTEFTAPIWR